MKVKANPLGLFALFFICIQSVQSAKILFLLPVASKSHCNVFEPLVRALGERGHDIVSFLPQKSKNMPPSVKEIVIVPLEDLFKTMQSPFEQRQMGKLASFANFSTEYLEIACRTTLKSREFQDVVKNEKFDLVIIDTLLNYCILGILPEMNVPYIYVSTMVAPTYMVEPFGSRMPPSFVPSPFLAYSQHMTFQERTMNFLFNMFLDFVGLTLFLPKFEKIYQEVLGIKTTIPEIDANASLVLVNSHFTLTYPRPYLPDIIEVGGMHARDAKPLPKDLEDFISGAEHGCILFSLGSIAQGKDMPEEARQVFVKAFAKLKQRVLWKWETETMPELPPNVKLSKWIPQQDVLGHKNVVLFMSHGGLLSIQEAVYHGVPILGIPLFADQDLNIKQAEKAGFAQSVEIIGLKEQDLDSALSELLNNPSYAEKVKELSEVWRDQPLKPLDTAVFWSEYVIRHKGSKAMRSAARDLNFAQYHSLDVISFLLAILLGTIYLTVKFCKCLCGRLCKSRAPASSHGSDKRSKKTN